MKGIGERLKNLRENENISQRQMSRLLGLLENGYANYEHEHTEPSIKKIVLLAEILHTSVQYIIMGEILAVEFDKEVTPFPQRLRELRKKKQLTQTEVASELGIRKVTYQGYEYNKYEPKLDKLLQLADLFDVTLDELLGRNEK